MSSQQLETLAYLDADGRLSPTTPLRLEGPLLVRAYKVMLLTRHLDERMTTLQRQGAITFALSSRGEEACAVASAAALEPCDWMYPQYREAGIFFWRGATVQAFVDQMFGNKNDNALGRQMPNHFGSREHNIVHVSSPIATKIPHAAGCAYAMKLQKERAVAICYFGEGATSEGDFHGGVNFAAVRRVPAIFFCRNNGYAISTPAREQYASQGIAPKGEGYGITTYRVDGNDFFAIYDAVARGRAQCLDGRGPILIEALTYRMGAHSTSDDPTRYRPQQEVELHEKLCPLRRLRLYLEREGLWSTEQEESWREEVKEQVTAAIEKARSAGPPPLQTLFEDVYSTMPETLKAQYRDACRFLPEGGGDE